jgi:hypothetical protein
MAEDQFSDKYRHTYQRPPGPDDARRWYAWQIPLRSQPFLIQHTQMVQQVISSVSGIHLVSPHWLRLPLCTVGSTDEISYSTANEIAESVAAKLQQIASMDIEIAGFTSINGSLVLKLSESEVLDHVQSQIRASADEHTYQAVTDYHVPIAVDKTESALDVLAGSYLATTTVRIRIFGVSHVLFNPKSFVTSIWTNLNVLGLRDRHTPGDWKVGFTR